MDGQIRHPQASLEFFFYLVTGPLVTLFAVKKLMRKKDKRDQILELQRRIAELEQEKTNLFLQGK